VKANLCGQLLLLLFFCFFLKKINLIRNGVSDEVFTLLAEWKQTKNDVTDTDNMIFFLNGEMLTRRRAQCCKNKLEEYVCACVFCLVLFYFPDNNKK
jgi:hypothetical protein